MYMDVGDGYVYDLVFFLYNCLLCCDNFYKVDKWDNECIFRIWWFVFVCVISSVVIFYRGCYVCVFNYSMRGVGYG